VIYGSGILLSDFVNLGLIDEYHLLVNPVILGDGKPLFKQVLGSQSLKLASSKAFGNGVVLLVYHRAENKDTSGD